jgi:hypothetical protein
MRDQSSAGDLPIGDEHLQGADAAPLFANRYGSVPSPPPDDQNLCIPLASDQSSTANTMRPTRCLETSFANPSARLICRRYCHLV